MSKKLRLIVRENETPPALYQRIVAGRGIRKASADIRALAMIAVTQNLDVEPLHEQYVGDTRLTMQFTLEASGALEGKIDQVMKETGLPKTTVLLKLVTAGWFHKTNPRPASELKPIVADTPAPATQQIEVKAQRKPTEQPKATEMADVSIKDSMDQAMRLRSDQMIDSVMAAFG